MRLCGEAATFDKAGLAQGGQAFQQGLHRSGAATLESAGDSFGGGGAQIGQGGADGGDLFGQGFGPWGLGGGHGGANVHCGLDAFGHGGMACGVLVVGAQPADMPARFLGSAFAVQVHQMVQDFIIGQGGGPAVGLRHRPVNLVVQVVPDADQALVIEFAVTGPMVRALLTAIRRLRTPPSCA